MKRMAAGAFKANCVAVMDDVQAKHETVVITKHGKPVAKLIEDARKNGDGLAISDITLLVADLALPDSLMGSVENMREVAAAQPLFLVDKTRDWARFHV